MRSGPAALGMVSPPGDPACRELDGDGPLVLAIDAIAFLCTAGEREARSR
jgi:hypothetical protein